MDLNQKSKGFGDTVAKVTKLTGIKAVVDKVAEKTGKDCGCNKRRDTLNRLIPYRD
jgi:hypothetical protein|tara:strand:+ start:841 stop:1008 length:168 start_codon:yes stop_codon:yes gene_type:complete